jgi:glycosyltransferase involved in cell wall biosynthesis/GT2 family glycosyltransferase
MKICLVSNEILGAHRNGGIGTTTSHLALLLSDRGHSVTLFYTGPASLEPLSPWAAYYAMAKITVTHYPGAQARISPHWMRQPVGIYEQLREASFEVILFQDWMALGHACIIAKRAGLAFQRTTLSVITHSSTKWILEANRVFPTRAEQLALMHMEQQAVELADAVVSPSQYLKDWMASSGWKLPSATSIIPYFLGGPELLGATPQLRSRPQRVGARPTHLVFFGRLEERKGISIFLAALAAPQLRQFPFALSFLGRPASRSPEEIKAFIGKHRPDLLYNLDIQPNLSTDEAQAYLSALNCVAVIPSLIDNSPCVVYEALKLGLPFIAAASGGIPELIEPADRERCLFAPTSGGLAEKIREVLSSSSWPAPRPNYDQAEIGDRWIGWFAKHAPPSAPVANPNLNGQAADVTVVVTHFERPQLLEQNLRALGMQSDLAFQTVVVDDGSTSDAALVFLDRAGRGLAGIPIEVVRQSNKYVGAARNEGLRHMDTPYVIFLDDDNIPFPNMVEVFRRAMNTSGADIVTCQMQMFSDPAAEPNFAELLSGERWAFPGGPAALGLVQNCFGDATAIYKRELFERTGCFHETAGVTHEDWQLHLRASLDGQVLLSLPLPLFWYRVAPDSMVRNTSPYANMRVVASAFAAKMPPAFAPMIDLMVGMHWKDATAPPAL